MAVCKICKGGVMIKHSDPNKAAQGITVCTRCNIAHSPNALLKESTAIFNPITRRVDKSHILNGVRVKIY